MDWNEILSLLGGGSGIAGVIMFFLQRKKYQKTTDATGNYEATVKSLSASIEELSDKLNKQIEFSVSILGENNNLRKENLELSRNTEKLIRENGNLINKMKMLGNKISDLKQEIELLKTNLSNYEIARNM